MQFLKCLLLLFAVLASFGNNGFASGHSIKPYTAKVGIHEAQQLDVDIQKGGELAKVKNSNVKTSESLPYYFYMSATDKKLAKKLRFWITVVGLAGTTALIRTHDLHLVWGPLITIGFSGKWLVSKLSEMPKSEESLLRKFLKLAQSPKK